MHYRQGDVLVRKVEEVRGKPVARDRGRIVLAYGEVTGHSHAIASKQAELTETEDGRRFLKVLTEAGVDLVHQEHDTITLPRGSYEVIRQREFTPWGERAVSD